MRSEGKSYSISPAPALNAARRSPLTVLQVVPRLGDGGAERSTVDVAAALVRAGGRAFVATAGGRLVADVERQGGCVFLLPVERRNPLTILANAVRLAAIVRQNGIAIVHARSRAPAWSALLAARLAGAWFVTTYHGRYNAKSALKRWYNSVMARGDRVIANSAFTRAHVESVYPWAAARLVTIPRGIALGAFDPAAVAPARAERLRRAWGIASGERIVLLAGRLSQLKGQDLLIDAAALLAAEPDFQDVRFVLVGDTTSAAFEARLRSRAAANGTADRIVFAGHCSDIPAAMQAATVVVSASREPETFGRTLVEAAAAGRIVVASDHGGARETVRDGETGFLVTPDDARALALGIAKVLRLSPEAQHAISARARAHAGARYSVERMCADTLALYRELAGPEV